MQPHRIDSGSKLAQIGLRLSDWFERWFPDAFALALVAVAIVFAACIVIGSSVAQTAQWFGSGFWDLVAFTMQMSMIIITGYAVATAPPIFSLIRRMAGIPKNWPQCGSVRRSFLNGHFTVVLEFQPDLQRIARPRSNSIA
jgi:short-chain fatty acids transporter